jgi:NitT/TauT family transport system permease protein
MTSASQRLPALRLANLAAWRPGRAAYGIAAIIVALGIWQAITSLDLISPAYISSPARAAHAGWVLIGDGELWSSSRASLYAFVIGFALSIAVGIPLGMAMGWSLTLRQLTEPPMMALYATPRLALLPVIVVWLGIGAVSTVAVVFIGAVIPIIINAMAGIRDVDTKLIQVSRSFGMSRLDMFRKVLAPASTPYLLTGIRLAVGRAVLGVIVSEMYISAGSGIGNLVTTYGQAYRTDFIVFLTALVAVFGYLVSALVRQLENHVEGWRGT